MAVTDDERRRVAERLREYVDMPDDWWADTYPGFYVEKCAFGNVERHKESELFARLADLIEPSIPADPGEAGLACVDAFIREHTEKPVDRDALLAVAETLEDCAGRVSDLTALGYSCLAKRIREALGVES